MYYTSKQSCRSLFVCQRWRVAAQRTESSGFASQCIAASSVASQCMAAGRDRACCTPVSRAASRCVSASGDSRRTHRSAQNPVVSHRRALLRAVSHRSAQKLGATEPAVHQLAELPLAVCLPAVTHVGRIAAHRSQRRRIVEHCCEQCRIEVHGSQKQQSMYYTS